MVKRTLGPCKPEVKDTAYNMLVRPKLEYASPIWNPHKSSQISRLEKSQHYAARFVANDHRRTTSPTTLVLTLKWQTLERRRIIKQAMTFYKILNNIIKISPPSGLLTRSHNRHHYIVPRSRLDTVGQFHDERDKVKINKYVYFHCKLITLTQTVLYVLGKNICILLANLFS